MNTNNWLRTFTISDGRVGPPSLSASQIKSLNRLWERKMVPQISQTITTMKQLEELALKIKKDNGKAYSRNYLMFALRYWAKSNLTLAGGVIFEKLKQKRSPYRVVEPEQQIKMLKYIFQSTNEDRHLTIPKFEAMMAMLFRMGSSLKITYYPQVELSTISPATLDRLSKEESAVTVFNLIIKLGQLRQAYYERNDVNARLYHYERGYKDFSNNKLINVSLSVLEETTKKIYIDVMERVPEGSVGLSFLAKTFDPETLIARAQRV